jgi:hypothetical protein
MSKAVPSVPAGSDRLGELRDTERAIALWHQKAAECGGHPPLSVFDFSRMDGGDCAYRFVICADPLGSAHKFLVYGSHFARLLALPEAPAFGVLLADHLPDRYCSLFIEGCEEALAQGQPVNMNRYAVHLGQVELYRAAFMPLAVPPNSPVRFVLGSFNRRIGPKASATGAVRKAYQSLFEASENRRPA